MYTSFIRAFAVMLALTGFSAASYSGTMTTGSSISHTANDSLPGGTTTPTPLCPPNDPNACGID